MREVSLLTIGLARAQIFRVSHAEDDKSGMLAGRSAMVICTFWTVTLLLHAFLLAGCSQTPIARMDSYLGLSTQGTPAITSAPVDKSSGPFDVGLLVINDISAQDSAPALSDKARAFLTDQVQRRVETAVPIRIVTVLAGTEAALSHDSQRLRQFAQERAVPYLLLALFSSAESEVPTYLGLGGSPEQGGGRPNVPGFEANNYALAELALLNVATGQLVARADGRAWSQLLRLYVPIKSNVYPVVHRSLRTAPIYPPEDQAKDVLRSIAGDEALEQAVMHLQESWAKRSAS